MMYDDWIIVLSEKVDFHSYIYIYIYIGMPTNFISNYKFT
jgi:hypothetical protein